MDCIKMYITNNLNDGPVTGFAWKFAADQPFNKLKSYVFGHFPEYINQNLKFYYKGMWF